MKLTENLSLFTQGVFAEKALINGVEIWGVLDENYDPMFNPDGLTSEGKNITFLVCSEEIKDINHGAVVKVVKRTFEVVNIQPIDDGKLSNLILKER